MQKNINSISAELRKNYIRAKKEQLKEERQRTEMFQSAQKQEAGQQEVEEEEGGQEGQSTPSLGTSLAQSLQRAAQMAAQIKKAATAVRWLSILAAGWPLYLGLLMIVFVGSFYFSIQLPCSSPYNFEKLQICASILFKIFKLF